VLKLTLSLPLCTFDLDVDSNGRWSVEKFKGLIFQIERDANAHCSAELVEGRVTLILCSADVASALAPWQVFLITPLHSTQTSTLMTLVTPSLVFLQGKYRVYIDPYSANVNC
jgi:hypothetical protein